MGLAPTPLARPCPLPPAQLKTPLADVSISLAPPEGAAADEGSISPAGEWDAHTRLLSWPLPQLGSGDHAVRCAAELSGVGGGEGEGGGGPCKWPVHVKFFCEGVTISGIELEVQLGAEGQPVAQLHRRFSSGDYKVTNG